MAVLPIIRLVVFALVLIFTAIILGLSANLLDLTIKTLDAYFIFSALAIAVTIITLITLVPMLVIDLTRKGSFTSWVVVELGVTAVLSVLWLSTAADATGDVVASTVFTRCNFINSQLNVACNSYKAIEAFGFLNWLLLMGYAITLFIFALIGQNRGVQKVWTSTVSDTNFFPARPATTAPQMQNMGVEKVEYGMPQQPMPMTPQQGYTGYPSQPGSPAPSSYPPIPQGAQNPYAQV